MDIWHYSRETGELLGNGTADKHPIVPDDWIHPAFSTTSAPPAVASGKAIVFSGAAWSSVPDHRGETWWKADAKDNTAPIVVDFIGDPAAKGLAKTEPPAPVVEPVVAQATPRQLFTALATAMGIPPDKIDALAELAKTL